MKNNKKELVELYKEIEKRITSLDFSRIYPDFSPYDFALYNNKIVVMKDRIIAHDHRFTGNTAIIFEGKYLAIWNIENIYVHFNVLTSKIVHEMFHAWQMDSKEIRFPNEFVGLGYLYEKYNISLKYDETRLLLKAYDEEDKEALEKFVSYREKRRSDYVNELYYEEGIETVEGMARYVELQVLKQLDVLEYQKAYDQLKNTIKNIRNYIPSRSISYEIGALMLLVKDKYDLNFAHKIGEETKPIYQILFSEIKPQPIFYEQTSLDLNFLVEYYEEITNRITSILESNPRVHVCDEVIGFDPLNSFRIGQYVHFRHFVMISQNHRQVFIHNESVGEVNVENRFFVIYEKNGRL